MPRRKRYCRFCSLLLPEDRWFFCGDDCIELYLEEKGAPVSLEEWGSLSRKVDKMYEPALLDQCRGCEYDCKVTVSPMACNYTILCRKSPDFDKVCREIENPTG